MTELTHHRLESNGITIHVAEAGQGRPVVLCHGFPELWSSWRHQIGALAEAGYRAIALDMRGYGETEAPGPVDAYTMDALTGDVAGVMDALGLDRAVVVGHDWGALVAWHVALRHADRLAGVAALSVPYSPRGDMRPTELYELFFAGKFFYMLYFQERDRPDAELAADVRHFLLRMMNSTSGAQPPVPSDLPREGTGYLDSLAAAPEVVPSWLDGHLDDLVAAFSRTGFTGALNWYRNLDRNWELSEDLAGAHVTVPALFVTGERDPLSRLLPATVMDGWVDDLRASVVLPGVGHWTGEEAPDGVNRALLDFLGGLGDW